MPVSPAAFSSFAMAAKRIPLVVMCTDSMPDVSEATRTRSTMPLRRSGSPPVKRIFVMPRSAARPMTRSISAFVRSLSLGAKSMPASGMQYTQRRLHRSVTAIRR